MMSRRQRDRRRSAIKVAEKVLDAVILLKPLDNFVGIPSAANQGHHAPALLPEFYREILDQLAVPTEDHSFLLALHQVRQHQVVLARAGAFTGNRQQSLQ